jgi:hypothetical protein
VRRTSEVERLTNRPADASSGYDRLR